MASIAFNAKGLYNIVEQIAYPRLLGTPGEKHIIAQIKTEFQKRGFEQSEILSHQICPTWMASIFLQTINGTLATIIFGILLTWIFAGPLFLSIWFVILIAAVVFFVIQKDHMKWTVETVATENIFVRVRPQLDKLGTILFASHFDTKSQSYPTHVETWLYVLGVLLGIPFLLLAFIDLLTVSSYQPENGVIIILSHILGWPAGVCFFILLFDVVQNKSVGAADNASGIAIVLELARYFKERSLTNFETIFVIFSAEEIGAKGASLWEKQYANESDPENSYILNFDMIGKPSFQYISPIDSRKKYTYKKLNSLVSFVARDLHIPTTPILMPFATMTDSYPFIKRGWESVDFVSQNLAKKAHTTRDTMVNIDGQILAQVCEIAHTIVEKIDYDATFLNKVAPKYNVMPPTPRNKIYESVNIRDIRWRLH